MVTVMQEDRKKDRECLHCEKLFKCKGKPKDVDRCVSFEARKGSSNAK